MARLCVPNGHPQQTSNNANPQKQPYNIYCDDINPFNEGIFLFHAGFLDLFQ
ncbi:5675_t:CDS:2, partial [Gigaspora rosea]